jgi:hypothetical protein
MFGFVKKQVTMTKEERAKRQINPQAKQRLAMRFRNLLGRIARDRQL